jgi:hypothetical protein
MGKPLSLKLACCSVLQQAQVGILHQLMELPTTDELPAAQSLLSLQRAQATAIPFMCPALQTH